MTGQLSLFGVEAGQPAVADLEGLLAGPGQVTRMGGTARLAVTVAERWRARALLAEVRTRGLAASATVLPDGSVDVRTAYAAALAPLAARWLRAGGKQAPSPLRLDGRRLRLWMIAAGVHDGACVLLGLGPGEEGVWAAARRALAGLGLSAELVEGPAPTPAGPPGGPGYRIADRRRLARLAELVGQPPTAAPPGAWPT